MASYTTSRHRIDELSRQTRAASKYSMLDADAEQALFRLWRNRHDMAAAQLLVASHLPLVVGIERRFRGYGLSPEELIGEAWVGLMRAVCRFDPDCGFSFATYATWWVRAAVQEFILRNWSSVSLGTTRAQRKLFLNLRHMHNKLRAADHGPLSNEQVSRISDSLQVPRPDVEDMDRRLVRRDSSLNDPASGWNNDDSWLGWLVDERDGRETVLAESEDVAVQKSRLVPVLQRLTGRERQVAVARRLRETRGA